MLKPQSLLLLFAIILFAACSSDDDPRTLGGGSSANTNRNITTNQPELSGMEFPKVKGGNSIVIVHKTSDSYNRGINFATEWDCEKMSQRWSCYVMVGGYQQSGVVRRDYRIDKSRETLYPWDEDMANEYYLDQDYFKGSGFDHGHVCPSADRLYSNLANDQTFYLTNMQPQYNKFNAGLWAEMEGKVRKWTPSAASGDTLFVCKGGTIDKEEYILKRISNKLIVPKYFYMALLMKNSLGYRAIAFWTENEDINRSSEIDKLKDFCISIDELENRTGIDFFCNLPDDIENKVESSFSLRAWGIPE